MMCKSSFELESLEKMLKKRYEGNGLVKIDIIYKECKNNLCSDNEAEIISKRVIDHIEKMNRNGNIDIKSNALGTLQDPNKKIKSILNRIRRLRNGR